jgi:hypothetical protein
MIWMQLRIVPRLEVALRCAYCHDDLGEGRRCPLCAVSLHDDCWLLAGLCPTLGCRPPLRILVQAMLARAPGASRWHLFWWLAIFVAIWATLIGVVPAFDKMFSETGLCMPDSTQTLISLSRLACSPVGVVLGILVALASVLAFRRWRTRPSLRQSLVGLSWLGVAFFPFAVVALFSPLTQMTGKL